MGSSIGPQTSHLTLGRVNWLAERLCDYRGVGLDISTLPLTNSTTNHPWYDSVTGHWIMPSGTILAKITATGLYTAIRRGQANGAAGAGVAVVTVDDPEAFAVGGVYTNGVLNFTVLSINYTTKVLTATANFGGAGIANNAELYDNAVLPGSEGVTGETVILTEDCDLGTGLTSIDQSVATINICKINESAMPYTQVTATMKTQLGVNVEWR